MDPIESHYHGVSAPNNIYVGNGMLSWCLSEPEQGSSKVIGKIVVKRDHFRASDEGVKMLEVQLKLCETKQYSSYEYLSTLQFYVEVASRLPADFKPADWVNLTPHLKELKATLVGKNGKLTDEAEALLEATRRSRSQISPSSPHKRLRTSRSTTPPPSRPTRSSPVVSIEPPSTPIDKITPSRGLKPSKSMPAVTESTPSRSRTMDASPRGILRSIENLPTRSSPRLKRHMSLADANIFSDDMDQEPPKMKMNLDGDDNIWVFHTDSDEGCFNCGALETGGGTWRSGEHERQKLCNACGLWYSKNKTHRPDYMWTTLRVRKSKKEREREKKELGRQQEEAEKAKAEKAEKENKAKAEKAEKENKAKAERAEKENKAKAEQAGKENKATSQKSETPKPADASKVATQDKGTSPADDKENSTAPKKPKRPRSKKPKEAATPKEGATPTESNASKSNEDAEVVEVKSGQKRKRPAKATVAKSKTASQVATSRISSPVKARVSASSPPRPKPVHNAKLGPHHMSEAFSDAAALEDFMLSSPGNVPQAADVFSSPTSMFLRGNFDFDMDAEMDEDDSHTVELDQRSSLSSPPPTSPSMRSGKKKAIPRKGSLALAYRNPALFTDPLTSDLPSSPPVNFLSPITVSDEAGDVLTPAFVGTAQSDHKTTAPTADNTLGEMDKVIEVLRRIQAAPHSDEARDLLAAIQGVIPDAKIPMAAPAKVAAAPAALAAPAPPAMSSSASTSSASDSSAGRVREATPPPSNAMLGFHCNYGMTPKPSEDLLRMMISPSLVRALEGSMPHPPMSPTLQPTTRTHDNNAPGFEFNGLDLSMFGFGP